MIISFNLNRLEKLEKQSPLHLTLTITYAQHFSPPPFLAWVLHSPLLSISFGVAMIKRETTNNIETSIVILSYMSHIYSNC